MSADREVGTVLDDAKLLSLGYSMTQFRAGRGCLVWDEPAAWVGVGVEPVAAPLASVVLRRRVRRRR